MKKIMVACVILGILCLNADAQYTKLLDFFGEINGEKPFGSLVLDGNYLYGMTSLGGINNYGTIFKMKKDGNEYVKLFDFNDSLGVYPSGDLYENGTFLYGMTLTGGLYSSGVIFKIKPDGSGFVKLFDFSGANGKRPYGSLISDGVYLYGMTKDGGENDDGVIFKIKPDGTGFNKLLDFDGIIKGSYPVGSLMYDGTFLYGMTKQGGIKDGGVIFKIKTNGDDFSKLFDFEDAISGYYPNGSLISDGKYLYGTTSTGGPNSFGVLFKIKPDGTGYENVKTFSNLATGTQPCGTLFYDGFYLYGMSTFGGTDYYGTIYKIRPDGTGFNTLFNFKGTPDGAYPIGSIISDGFYLHGMTAEGGSLGKGELFKIVKFAVGEAEIKENTAVTLYPNPAKEELTVTSPREASIELLNVLGQVLIVTKSQDGRSLIDVNNLPKGIYFIKQHFKDKTHVASFLKE